jgi:hypothetical protein
MNDHQAGGTFTRLADLNQNQAKKRPMGKPIRVCIGSFPVATCSMANAAEQT